MGESTEIIQVLIVIAIILVSVWTSIKKANKAAKQHRQQGQRGDFQGENFPFPPVAQQASGDQWNRYDADNENDIERTGEPGTEIPGNRYTAKQGMDEHIMLDHMAVSSIVFEEELADDLIEKAGESEEDERKRVELLDLRKMIIYSELMNPKYKEY